MSLRQYFQGTGFLSAVRLLLVFWRFIISIRTKSNRDILSNFFGERHWRSWKSTPTEECLRWFELSPFENLRIDAELWIRKNKNLRVLSEWEASVWFYWWRYYVSTPHFSVPNSSCSLWNFKHSLKYNPVSFALLSQFKTLSFSLGAARTDRLLESEKSRDISRIAERMQMEGTFGFVRVVTGMSHDCISIIPILMCDRCPTMNSRSGRPDDREWNAYDRCPLVRPTRVSY
jgi:hypothetical protein